MRFKIIPAELLLLMKPVFLKAPRKTTSLTITAIEGQVYLETPDSGAFGPAEVLTSGQVVLPAKSFRQIVETYKSAPMIEIEGSSAGLRINSFKMPLTAWNPKAQVPDSFC